MHQFTNTFYSVAPNQGSNVVDGMIFERVDNLMPLVQTPSSIWIFEEHKIHYIYAFGLRSAQLFENRL